MTQTNVNSSITPLVDLTPSKKKETEVKPSINHLRDKDREKVKGIFKFYEVPGGSMSFVHKEYKGEKVERYDMIDGQVYTVPLGVAKHLNKNGWYPLHAHAVDANGNSIAAIRQKVRRFGFQSLEFIDIEELNHHGEIIQVDTNLVAI